MRKISFDLQMGWGKAYQPHTQVIRKQNCYGNQVPMGTHYSLIWTRILKENNSHVKSKFSQKKEQADLKSFQYQIAGIYKGLTQQNCVSQGP